ncbi:hypothetical protein QM565_33680 [Geitlerinema splendidum]|nr:hypothetical protein [Geitlerinema splendidum]
MLLLNAGIKLQEDEMTDAKKLTSYEQLSELAQSAIAHTLC